MYSPIKIFTPNRTLLIANMLKQLLEIHNITCIIVNFIDIAKDDLYIILCHHTIKLFPKYYIIYQLEQATKSPYFTNEYMHAINNSIFTIDYNVLNMDFLKKSSVVDLLYFPIPTKNNIIQLDKYDYDIVFYGALNKKRTIILNKLKSLYKVNIVTNKFGNDLLDEISRGKIILNLHYYNNALLETARLNESLQFENVIISEIPDINDPNFELYKNGIEFVDEICTNEPNITNLIKIIDENLQMFNDGVTKNKYYEKRKEFINMLKEKEKTHVDNLVEKIKKTLFLHKLEIPTNQFRKFDNIEDFILKYHKNEWNYTKTLKKIINDPNEIFKYFCCNQLEKIKLLSTKNIKKYNDNEAVLIELSDHPHVEFILRNTIDKLNNNWSHTVVCCNKNFEYITNMCKNISENIVIINFDLFNTVDTLNTVNTVDTIITSKIFWNKITGSNILIYNSTICFVEDINDELLKHDYIYDIKTCIIKKNIAVNILEKNSYNNHCKIITKCIEDLQNSSHTHVIKKKFIYNKILSERQKLNVFNFFYLNLNEQLTTVQYQKYYELFKKSYDINNNNLFLEMCKINWNINKRFNKEKSYVKYELYNVNNKTFETNCDNDFNNAIFNKTFGFIMLRFINSDTTKKYWQECYKHIRKNYDDVVIIIDDNSDQKYIDKDLNKDFLTNTIIINTEFGYGHGEILPYYYINKLNIFDKSVILHDSMFINKKYDFKNMNEKPLWHFTAQYENYDYENFLLKQLNYSDDLITIHKNFDKWVGNFGCCGVVNLTTIKILNNKYKLFNLINHITAKCHRSCFERIIAILYTNENITNKSICGNIHEYKNSFSYSYAEYEHDKRCDDIVKIWTGR